MSLTLQVKHPEKKNILAHPDLSWARVSGRGPSQPPLPAAPAICFHSSGLLCSPRASSHWTDLNCLTWTHPACSAPNTPPRQCVLLQPEGDAGHLLYPLTPGVTFQQEVDEPVCQPRGNLDGIVWVASWSLGKCQVEVKQFSDPKTTRVSLAKSWLSCFLLRSYA